MYTLWQAHNSQEQAIEQIPDISSLNVPDITNTQPLTAAPHLVINGSDNNTRIGPSLQFCDLDGIPRVNVFYEPFNNLISFQALVDDPTPTFVFNGNVLASNIQN
jgi:hypothetical protein